jgi:hypothetical protein
LRRFQDELSEVPVSVSGPAWDVLTDLATDLEFYESDPQKRMAHPSYYGDEKLMSTLSVSLAELKKLGIASGETDTE